MNNWLNKYAVGELQDTNGHCATDKLVPDAGWIRGGGTRRSVKKCMTEEVKNRGGDKERGVKEV